VENAFNSFDDFFVVQQIAAIRFGKALFDCVIEPRVVFGDAIECFFLGEGRCSIGEFIITPCAYRSEACHVFSVGYHVLS
jgi:hypothetical protein